MLHHEIRTPQQRARRRCVEIAAGRAASASMPSRRGGKCSPYDLRRPNCATLGDSACGSARNPI
jgi:hypothetical protein